MRTSGRKYYIPFKADNLGQQQKNDAVAEIGSTDGSVIFSSEFFADWSFAVPIETVGFRERCPWIYGDNATFSVCTYCTYVV